MRGRKCLPWQEDRLNCRNCLQIQPGTGGAGRAHRRALRPRGALKLLGKIAQWQHLVCSFCAHFALELLGKIAVAAPGVLILLGKEAAAAPAPAVAVAAVSASSSSVSNTPAGQHHAATVEHDDPALHPCRLHSLSLSLSLSLTYAYIHTR